MKREDVLNVDALKEELSAGIQALNKTLRSVFGEIVYALDTVIDSHNHLEAELTTVKNQLATVSERLLALEKHLGPKH